MSGIPYPDVREKIPVELSYASPVAVDENTPRVVEVENDVIPVRFEPSP